ncbi:histone acetyltransferase HAC12-like isoform X2 [Olea europaea subsp. europaea]|uniref:histone acetyltransferase n=1 Tax=Olea europaea subsp. europaea TaxID=158383 RepID=A0A8S0TE79_OLEEU|nr:histone acetyltransferase HAC12-like isoform X2 [Olea europaea subsp. europaea]
MDYDPVFNRGIRSSIEQFSSLRQMCNIGSNHNNQWQSDWGCYSSHINDFSSNMIEENLQQKIYSGSRKQISDSVTDMERQLFGVSAFEDCPDQDMQSCNLENLIQHEIGDNNVHHEASSFLVSSQIPILRTTPGLHVSPSSYNSNPPYPGFDYSAPSGNVCGTTRTYGINDSHGFQRSCSNDQELVASDGKNMFFPMDLMQVVGDVDPSSDHISSIGGYSNETHSIEESFDGGPAFCCSSLEASESTSQNYYLQKYGESNLIKEGGLSENYLMKDGGLTDNYLSAYHMDAPFSFGKNVELDKYSTWLPQQLSERILGDSGTVSSMTAWISKSSHDEPLQSELQVLGSNNCHQQPAYFNESSNAQTHGCTTKIECSTQSCMVQQEEVQLQETCFHNDILEGPALSFGPVGAAKPKESILSLVDILLLYTTYKSIPVNMGTTRENFLDYLHLTVCNVQKCECEIYHILVSHFDDCHDTGCSICGPVRELYPTGETHSGAGKSKRDLPEDLHARDSNWMSSCSVEDIQPPLKRTKIESSILSNNRPLSAVTFPVNQPCKTKGHPLLGKRFGSLMYFEEEELVMKNELLSSTEDPIKGGVPAKGSVDNIRFERVNALGAVTLPVDQPCGSLEDPLIAVNIAVDKNRLESANACFRRTVVYSELRKPSEGPMYDQQDSSQTNKELLMSIESHPVMDGTYTSKVKTDVTLTSEGLSSDSKSVLSEECTNVKEDIKIKDKANYAKIDMHCSSAESAAYCMLRMESQDSKRCGVSLTDFFNAQQIKEHLSSLNQNIGQSIMKGSTENTRAQSLGQNTCQLCARDRIMLTSPPMYCSYCGACIKSNMTYYWTADEMDARYCFCTLCFRKSRGGKISFRGLSFSKTKLQKDKNTAGIEESWVQCDECECWQHQTCALYNPKSDLEGKRKYICPFCRLAEIGVQEHVSIPTALGAKDLPRTKLSDHIELRLFKSLDRERKQRAKLSGKSPTEVPGAADLVVRVVLAVSNRLKVKQQFLDIFHGQRYPAEFPYKSEKFGSDCGPPNQRCVYISYLDSVKYFRPEIRTATGEALRTFVYHEILIAYLDYCKKCGFTTCYIWACPPIKGEDYILYCHPDTQKTPKSDKLRHWYKSMIRKAVEKKVVVDHTNFYDHFFVPNVECNVMITAARLPYFDGAYWSTAAEDVMQNIGKGSGGGSEKMVQKLITRRTLKSMGHGDLSADVTKDLMVMEKVGQTILPTKEDFIVLHLQFTCTNCHEAILSGSCWACKQCKKFHLCVRCLEVKSPTELKTHTSISGEKHLLSQILVNDVLVDTEDKDVILDNDIFTDRRSFLSFCEENNYQFDTLRRAKHSSMMILYHLHKMTTLTKQRTCSLCHNDVVLEWRCEICPGLDVCSMCYSKEGEGCHVHPLIPHVLEAYSETKNKRELENRKAFKKKEMLDLLEHANQCQATRDNPCSRRNCVHIKWLFRHSCECEIRLAGNCKKCKRIWYLLLLHSEECKDSNCHMPRCLDIKKRKQVVNRG